MVSAAAGSHPACVQLDDGTIIVTIEDADECEDWERLTVFPPKCVIRSASDPCPAGTAEDPHRRGPRPFSFGNDFRQVVA